MKKKGKKIVSILLLLALVTAALCGCGGAGNDAENDGLREIDVVLDWYPNALHAFIYTAMERGYYADEGLKINVQFPSNANDALSLVAAGKAEVGIYYQHDIIQAAANQNVHVKAIGPLLQSTVNVILSLKDKNITSPMDFEGKTIGYAGTELSEAFIESMMEAAGADTSKVNLIDVGFELMSAMTTGNVDATIGCMLNHEVPQMEYEGFEVNYFLVTDYDGVPEFYECLFLTNDDMIENEQDVLAAFLRASKKGFEDFKADPDACLQILLDNQNEENFPLTAEVEQQSCQVLLPIMETTEAGFMEQSEEVWKSNIDWMYERGLISQKIDVTDVMAVIEY